ncbi:MAG TPA: alpha/beta hydrolase [Holophagaceae bacterium]
MPPPPEERPLLVLLPGMDGTGRMFGPFLAALPEVDTQVVRYPEALVSYAACTHFARTQLPKDRPYLLLGESFSGPVALALAAESPSGLKGLILCGTFARNPRPGLVWLMPLLRRLPPMRLPLGAIRLLLLGGWSTPPLMDLVRSMLPEVPGATLKGRLLSVGRVDHTSVLARIRVPVLALAASRDRLVPPSALRHLRAHLKGLDILTLQGPHWLLQARPDAAAQALRDFQARIG